MQKLLVKVNGAFYKYNIDKVLKFLIEQKVHYMADYIILIKEEGQVGERVRWIEEELDSKGILTRSISLDEVASFKGKANLIFINHLPTRKAELETAIKKLAYSFPLSAQTFI